MKEKTFEDLNIEEPILKAIQDKNFTQPTTIQAKAIPTIIEGYDVVGGSRTGSGKTLAFSCGIIQNTIPGEGVQALVLVPTRELAEQVAESFKTFSKYKKLKIVKVYGGVSINPQMEKLQKADIVIATPGRILDHVSRKTVDLSKVKTLVLDEADMMADMGFLEDVERIIKSVPKKRQTLLFSATISDDIYHFTKKHLNDPVKVNAEKEVDPKKLKQIYYDVLDTQKFALLVKLLKEEKDGLVMVFCNTRENVDFVVKNLKANKVSCRAIHGGLNQNKRNNILQEFHDGKVYALVCTDVAARGLDIKGVSHVYNYDTPKDPKQYVHRIGRTARAGTDGMAITILGGRDHGNFSNVLHVNQVNVKKERTPKLERVEITFKPTRRSNNSRSKYGNRNRR